MNEQQPEPDAPRIYVASLVDYNDGELVGTWLDADQDEDVLEAGVAAMLRASPTPGAEEFAIHDYDGFRGLQLDEYESLSTVVRLARGIREHGDAFAAWARLAGVDAATEDGFADHYLGSWDSVSDYVESMVDELGLERYVAEVPAELQPYIRVDYDGLARDAVLSGEIEYVDGHQIVHVFRAPGAG